MNKFYIVEDIRFDSKFKTEEEIKINPLCATLLTVIRTVPFLV